MNDNLVICPSINRPEQLSRMVESFYNKSILSDLIILTAKGSITTYINQVKYDNYKYVTITNDDFIFHTYSWDLILMETIERKGQTGFAFGNDGSNNKELPTTCLMSTDIPKALGYIQLPELTHLCGDMVWQTLGKLCNCLYYVPQVKTEHMHYMFGKAEKRDYVVTNSEQMYRADNAVFQEWLLHRSNEDADKIKEIMK